MKRLRTLFLLLALGALPAYFVPVQASAQQNDDRQRAYQAGYQNGVSDRQQNKSLNLRTDNWQGINLQAYQQGYENGYRSAGRNDSGWYGNGQYGTRDHDGDRDDRSYSYGSYGQNDNNDNNDARQRAYQAGYQNGVNDRQQNKSLNLKTDNWHGDRLQAYQQGYEEGYQRAGGHRRHHHDDDDDDR